MSKRLAVMDSTAASMARDNGIKLVCFDITESDALIKASKEENTHTKVIK